MEGCCSNFGKVFRLLGMAACITVVSAAGMADSVTNTSPALDKSAARDGSLLPGNSRSSTAGLKKAEPSKGGVVQGAVTKVEKNAFAKPTANPAFGLGKDASGTIAIERGGADGSDACGTPSLISGAGTFPFSNVGATLDGIGHGACLSFGSNQIFSDVWFLWTSVAGGSVSVQTCGSTALDTRIAVYNGGAACPPSDADLLDCSDDDCGGSLQSNAMFSATAGNTYLIRIGSFSAVTQGSGTFSISESGGGGGGGGGGMNDNCADAEVIVCGGSATGDNTAATNEGGDPIVSCRFGGPDLGVGTIWYSFVATGNSATVSLCNSGAADTMVQILDGTCGAFTEVACNDDACGPNGLRSQATATGLTVGNTYYISVSSFDEAGRGAISLDLTCTNIAPCTDGTPENEPNCGLDGQGVNGGCNSTPPTFSPIVCGQTYCGSGGADGSFRDTDWYEVVLGSGTEMTFTVNATFPVLVGIVDNGGIPDCAGVSAFLVSATGAEFTDVSVTACVAPGTWWPFVAPSVFGGVACESGYEATLSCVPCSVTVPENDNCTGAIAVTLGTPVFGSTAFANPDPGLPACGTSISADGVWYTVVGDGGTFAASLCNPGTNYDTKIHVFCGDCNASQWICLAGDDDFCGFPPGHSTAFWCTNPGQVYYILVNGFGGGTGDFELVVTSDGVNCGGGTSCSTSGAPNDDCANAELIACGATVNGSNQFATIDPTDPNFDCSFGGPQQGVGSIWYRFVATQTSATVDLCASAAADTMVQILQGNCGELVSLACNDDSCGLRSAVTATGLTVGNTYYIEVAGFDAAGVGPITLSLTCTAIEPCVGTPENEPNCGLDGQGVNGGCNSTPPTFSPIVCGQTYCGSGGADGSFRDTDWYEVVLGSGTEMTFTVNATFPVLVGIVDNGGIPDCAGVSAFLVSATGAEFTDVSVTACVAPGTWWPFVAPSVFGGVACESGYEATLSCVPCSVTVPENDNCTGAIAVTLGTPVFGSTAFANPDPGLPACGTSISADGVWYTVVGDGGTFAASLCNPGTNYDTKIHVFCGDCNASQWICLAGDDDFCGFPPGHSTAFWCTNPGQVYYILVNGFGGGTGDFELVVTSDGVNCGGGTSCSTSGAPNDDCANAELIACGATVNGSNQFATIDPTDPNFDCSFGGPQQGVGSIWYRFVATQTSATVDLCASAAADTMVQILDGTCGAFVALACNDDFCGLRSQVTANGLVVGNTYYIQIAGFDAAGVGPITLTLLCQGACEVTCPVGAVTEPEPCDVDTISGCNSMPPAFIPIACGESVCGKGWGNGSFRDTDWYQLEIVAPNSRNVTWTVEAEFNVLIGIVENGGIPDCAGVSAFRVFATSTPCVPVSVNSLLPAGSWWFFVAPAQFTGPAPCAADTDYLATLDCGFGPNCQGDADGDGDVDLADVARVVANWGNPGGQGDVSGNGIVGLDDIALIIKNWGCGL